MITVLISIVFHSPSELSLESLQASEVLGILPACILPAIANFVLSLLISRVFVEMVLDYNDSVHHYVQLNHQSSVILN